MSWDADTREDFEERAAIMQFDGGMTRGQAELEARALIERRINPPVPEQMTLPGAETETDRFFRDMERRYGR